MDLHKLTLNIQNRWTNYGNRPILVLGIMSTIPSVGRADAYGQHNNLHVRNFIHFLSIVM